MCAGMFMAILDIQIVASSLPDIQTALAIPLDRLSWIQTAYLIAEIVAIPLTGRLTRLLSLGGLFVAAMTGFVAGSIGCGLSGGFAVLIAFRAVQGFCGGMLIPAVFTSVFVLFPERERVAATTVAGVFAVLAPRSVRRSAVTSPRIFRGTGCSSSMSFPASPAPPWSALCSARGGLIGLCGAGSIMSGWCCWPAAWPRWKPD